MRAHKFCATMAFFFNVYSLANSMTYRAQIFTGLLMYAYVGIHQARRLVFDNYQRCQLFSAFKDLNRLSNAFTFENNFQKSQVGDNSVAPFTVDLYRVDI